MVLNNFFFIIIFLIIFLVSQAVGVEHGYTFYFFPWTEITLLNN